MRSLRELLRSPTLHFVVLGGLVFAGERLLLPASLEAMAIRSPGATVAALSSATAGENTAVTSVPFDAAGETTLGDFLVGEALAAGLDRTDALVRDRLVRLGESIVSEDLQSRDALEREARRLGLDRSDPVVRRRLAHAMELVLSHLGPNDLPSEEDARAYYESHRQRYAQTGRVLFRHVYFARDREGVSAQRAANEALRVLGGDAGMLDSQARDTHQSAGERTAVAARGAHGPAGERADAAHVRGDAFLLGDELNLSAPEVARRFGVQFAAALEDAGSGRWFGPVASAYGLHLVRIEERSADEFAAFEAVRGRVVHDLLAERRARMLEVRVAQRRPAPSGSGF